MGGKVTSRSASLSSVVCLTISAGHWSGDFVIHSDPFHQSLLFSTLVAFIPQCPMGYLLMGNVSTDFPLSGLVSRLLSLLQTASSLDDWLSNKCSVAI